MNANVNIQFGKRIKPVEIKDVYRAGVSILFDTLSQNANSANITVGAEPWVIKVFNLAIGESISVYNVFGPYEEPTFYQEQPVVLTANNNTVILPIAGIYKLKANALFGSLVCIAYPISALDERARKSVDVTNPNGPQSNRPNTYYDGSAGEEYSQEFTIGSRPWVFRAYGIINQEIELQNTFLGQAESVVELGNIVKIDSDNTTLMVHISGMYRFKLIGDSTGVRLVGNPAVINETGAYLMRGEKGDTGAAGSGGTEFIQASPSNAWVINHNFGYKPAVELFTVGGVEFEAEVVHTSINQTVVYTTLPIAGSARLN